MEETMNNIMEKVYFYLNNRAKGNLKIGAIIFSNVFGVLGKTKNVDELMKSLS